MATTEPPSGVFPPGAVLFHGGAVAPRRRDREGDVRGLELRNPETAAKIGPGCKVCERSACPQRAFPMAGRSLMASTTEARLAPYSGAG